MKRLQVLSSSKWHYVFCYSGETNKIKTLRDDQRNMALLGRDLSFFQNKYANHVFRAN